VLDELLAQSHALVIDESPQVEDLISYKEMVNETEFVSQPWYGPIVYFLINGVFLSDIDTKSKRTLHLQVVWYVLQDQKLYRRNLDGFCHVF
jgi:hypothetical protein